MADDEYEQGGACMAAGRGFVHINAQGDVEPCPFAHFATHSVRTHSLQDALAAPMFAHIRGRPELSAKPSQGCALVEHRKILADAMSQFGVRNTELGPK
jgi:MoaA/NifB/PqqE/SkfB family radical SAM enzyme